MRRLSHRAVKGGARVGTGSLSPSTLEHLHSAPTRFTEHLLHPRLWAAGGARMDTTDRQTALILPELLRAGGWDGGGPGLSRGSVGPVEA